LTDSVRDHFYGCALVPEDVRRKARATREAARHLVKQSRELRDATDVLIIEAEAALHGLREAVREAPMHRVRENESKEGWESRPHSYHPLPMKLQVGDRFSDEAGEWEIASPPRATADGKGIHTLVRRDTEPVTVEERTWVAHERIRVRRQISRADAWTCGHMWASDAEASEANAERFKPTRSLTLIVIVG